MSTEASGEDFGDGLESLTGGQFERIGIGMIRPEGSAIKPRIPASCEMVEKPPFVAPEVAMVEILPSGSM